MDLLRLNAKECNPKPDKCKICLAKLDWCAENNLNTPVEDAARTEIGLLKDMKFDVLIGTDIVYWPTIIEPLVRTLVSLFD